MIQNVQTKTIGKIPSLVTGLAIVPLAMAGSMLSADRADAAFGIRLTSGASTTTIYDGSGSDISGLNGLISVNNIGVGNFTVSFTLASSKPIIGSASQPALDLTSFQATSTSGGGTLKILVTDTGFTGTPTYFLTSGTGLSLAGPLSVASYLDTGNGEFILESPLATLGLTPSSDSDEALSGLYAGGTPYSLTIETTLNHAGAGLSTYSADIKAVPEPITLLGSSIALGFGAHLKRKLKKAQKA
jgi:hypothetical protein